MRGRPTSARSARSSFQARRAPRRARSSVEPSLSRQSSSQAAVRCSSALGSSWGRTGMTSSVVARPPCFRALPRVFALPSSVLGPVLLAAFRLFAAIWASVAMGASPGEAATTRPGAWAQRRRCAVVASTYRRSRILGLQLHQSAEDRGFCPRGGPAIRAQPAWPQGDGRSHGLLDPGKICRQRTSRTEGRQREQCPSDCARAGSADALAPHEPHSEGAEDRSLGAISPRIR